MLLEPSSLKILKNRKNLLAFSAGVDSTALYHLLKEENIDFDIAIVNYKVREQSEKEVEYALQLANSDNRKCHLLEIELSGKNFEYNARNIRYKFFEELIEKYNYNNLITAHQLDDMLEWSLMQLCKGCGLAELIGMQPIESRESYNIVRPLLFTPKKSLLELLETKKIKYFLDHTNQSDSFKRNRFRKYAASFLMEESSSGIAKSFKILLQEKANCFPPPYIYFQSKKFYCIKTPTDDKLLIHHIDTLLKKEGYIASSAQREHILNSRSAVIGGEWCIEINDKLTYISAYIKPGKIKMPKWFKERCRELKIGSKVRPYLFDSVNFEELFSLLEIETF
ncbi:tRNA lysidine(34) synthetase TilS [Hydrogenimonas thermophila]|uniref:tRNA(Ile)-lysidine synthase n=1 Tax=Hydrogenimonas thermophila TaxID=223786 RepID=A0A1I5P8N8_9BACT|nr:tRNA lysidine(34) synthetase TilS [Hydrogenimonas thermophila]WOE69643.1 tRNA lysidine(34) synthetase TilS [Hydrogenimonas thermophila]WOE72157.1 tRNA lysidine(34) synthetase TilS [Hydrogenimonas thermophila]SFP30478.1 tRNA(Ile)-lysidine synthase [Hydrogenimonas thermophila]